jgi:hypothetical protein
MKYEVLFKIFWNDAVNILKLTIRPIGCNKPQSSSLPHVDTGPTISSILGTLPGNPFLSQCQVLSAIRPGSPDRRHFSFNFIFGNRRKSQGTKSAGWGRKCETKRCCGEAARSVLVKVRGDVFARFHTVAAKVAIEHGIHSLACWDRCFALPQLLYRWRHQSGIFWKPPRINVFSCKTETAD